MHSNQRPQGNSDKAPPSHRKLEPELISSESCTERHTTPGTSQDSKPGDGFDMQSPPRGQDTEGLADSPVETLSHRSFSNASSDIHNNSGKEHIIELSTIERCMPRAYIRVCLAYRLMHQTQVPSVVRRLNEFIHKIVDAKPYLAGYVVLQDKSISTGPVEVRFTTTDYVDYPDVEVCNLLDEHGNLVDYNELDAQGLPPSSLNPEKVAKLPASMADEKRAPVFRARANIAKGGIVVSFYLHHCISDGTGLGQLVAGSIAGDPFMFDRHANEVSDFAPSLDTRLTEFANMKTILRKQLSWSDPNQIASIRKLCCNRLDVNNGIRPTNPPGRGCVITFSDKAVDQLRGQLLIHLPHMILSKHDVLQAFIWRSMSRARLPSIKHHSKITVSKLLIPVNIRNRISPPLPESYFGAAVDFAIAEYELDSLVSNDVASFSQAARIIHEAILAVNEPYIRQAIGLARSSDPNVDVRDLLASNMNRVSGADLYITSWERLDLYNSTLDMGIGTPDWVRKPWSRDPGSCIVLPRNPQKAQYEVVIQMTVDDMARLLEDLEFRKYVTRVID